MPDDKVKVKDTDIDALLQRFQKTAERADDHMRADVYAKTPLLMQQGNCIRCHDRGPGFNNRTLDFTPIRGYDFPMPPAPKDAVLENVGKVLKQLPEKISFDLKPDGIKNVKGLNLLGIGIDELTVVQEDGKTKLRADGNIFGRKISQDINPELLGIPADSLKNVLSQLGELQKNLHITSINRQGDQFTIQREGASNVDFGGSKVMLGRELSFKLNTNDQGLKISDMRGVTVSMPLPDQLGLGSSYMTNIKGVSLGSTDRSGSRQLTVDADNVIDQVSLRLDKNFKPDADSSGNWNLRLAGNNPLSPDGRKDRMAIDLRIGKDGNVNMKPSEILDIASKLTGQASELSLTGISMGYTSVVTRVGSWIASWFE